MKHGPISWVVTSPPITPVILFTIEVIAGYRGDDQLTLFASILTMEDQPQPSTTLAKRGRD